MEESESFNLSNHDFGSTVAIGLKKGVVNKNETKVFDENELQWKREYYITYSTDESFSSYSFLHAELYIQEIIGDYKGRNAQYYLHALGRWFQNENTIISNQDLY